MSRTAGDYNQPFTWLLRTTTKDSTGNAPTGQDVETFTSNGLLWGQMFTDTAVEANAYGSLQTQSTATIRFRQWPTLSAMDRVVHEQFGETYMVTGIRRDGPDTICEAVLYDGQGPNQDV